MVLKKSRDHKASVGKRIFSTIMGIVVCLSLLSMIASAVIFKTVFRRRTITPYDITMEYSADDEIRYPREDIEFCSGENVIRGELYGRDNRQGIIIIINGFNATTVSHLAEIFYFVDDGWAVLVFDGTGNGKSGGKSVIGLEQTRKDALAAVDYVENSERFDGMPIFLYGHSVGGYAASTICDDDRISATVSISGFNAPCSFMKYYGRQYVGLLADISYPFMCIYDKILFGKDSNVSAYSHIMNSKSPVLIIQGTEDEIVPAELSIYTACADNNKNNVELLSVDEQYRNRHSTIWLTTDAAKIYLELKDSLDTLEQDRSAISCQDEEKKISAVSNETLRQVNTDFLHEISAFYARAITK